MSLGYIGICKKVAEDDSIVIYSYAGENWNDDGKSKRGDSQLQDGMFTIYKDSVCIDIESCMPYTPVKHASRDAHNFAKTAGVFTAVKNHIGDESLEGVVIADLNKKNIAMLKAYAKTAKCPGKLVEVMSCPGGCITGPCSCSNPGEATRRFDTEIKKI